MSDGVASLPPLRLFTPRPRARGDWNEIRGRIDLAKVAAALLGPPVERRGLRTGSLGWNCPFDEGHRPSFQVIMGEDTWSCSECGAGGDAAALVMRIKTMSFRDAIAWLDEQEGIGPSAHLDFDHERVPAARAYPVLRRDLSAIDEQRAIMDRVDQPGRSRGGQPD